MNQIQFIKRIESEWDFQEIYLINDEKILYLSENKFNPEYSCSNGDYKFSYSDKNDNESLISYSDDKEEILNQMKNYSI